MRTHTVWTHSLYIPLAHANSHFPLKVFGLCRVVLTYSTEASDLETPEYTDLICEVFNTEVGWLNSPHYEQDQTKR